MSLLLYYRLLSFCYWFMVDFYDVSSALWLQIIVFYGSFMAEVHVLVITVPESAPFRHVPVTEQSACMPAQSAF